MLGDFWNTSIVEQRFIYYYYYIVAVIIMNDGKIIKIGGDDDVTFYDERDVSMLYTLLTAHNGFHAFERAEELIVAQNGEPYLSEILDSTKKCLTNMLKTTMISCLLKALAEK